MTALAAREGRAGLPHPKIPLPRDLYGPQRLNAAGLDLANEHRLAFLSAALLNSEHQIWRPTPVIVGEASDGALYSVRNPTDSRDIVGECRSAMREEVPQARAAAAHHGVLWSGTPPDERAAVLQEAANRLEAEMQPLIGLLVREVGKSFRNAVAEVREAVDFLRYYACQIVRDFDNDSYRPLGPVVCISPWNFPLAIFTGQIDAAAGGRKYGIS